MSNPCLFSVLQGLMLETKIPTLLATVVPNRIQLITKLEIPKISYSRYVKLEPGFQFNVASVTNFVSNDDYELEIRSRSYLTIPAALRNEFLHCNFSHDLPASVSVDREGSLHVPVNLPMRIKMWSDEEEDRFLLFDPRLFRIA
jgi:hypothetical protein